MAPPGDWPLAAYRAIGRNDLAASGSEIPDMLFSDGYRSMKDFFVRRNLIDPAYVYSSLSRGHHNVVEQLARLSTKPEPPHLDRSTLYLASKLI